MCFCFQNFVNVGLTNTFTYSFKLLKLWESGIFDRLGAELIRFSNTERESTRTIDCGYNLCLQAAFNLVGLFFFYFYRYC